MAHDINQFLVVESGRINYDIYERSQFTSPWITLPKKIAFPQGMGERIQNIMWERPYVQTEKEWAAMNLNEYASSDTGSGEQANSCIPPVDDVMFSQTLREFSLFHKAVHSPRFCVTDLLYTAKREMQMRAVENGLSEIVRLYWIKWNRDGFTRWAKKYVVEPGMAANYTDESDGMKFPYVNTTSRLTNGVLDYFYNLLTVEQGHRHALSTQNGRPIYGLITDQNTSRALIRDNDAIREDFHYGKPDALLQPLGVSVTYNGFIHMMDEAPPRWNFNADKDSDGSSSWSTVSGDVDPWVAVPHYILAERDDGTYEKIVNPAWLAAEAQDSYIYVREAYQLRVPGSVSSVSQAQFDPQNYMGDFKWQNVVNVDESSAAYNPDGKLGRFRGVLASGVEPINPHVMIVVRHQVCATDYGFVACTSDSSS